MPQQDYAVFLRFLKEYLATLQGLAFKGCYLQVDQLLQLAMLFMQGFIPFTILLV
ncbi:hypothetical protein KKB64_02175 [Patescibacteria group bacterium]|nr:hypothetical protein [Patescibacteria group bacterium]MBU1472575.1 hypothetical protein [Patescibacteria group bacterium]MBU2459826.1 hypothetical protein [Patescibacteria group bacterium]